MLPFFCAFFLVGINKKSYLCKKNMSLKVDNVGEIFGKLKVIGEAEGYKQLSGKFVKKVLCKCECGVEKILVYKDLKKGDTKSCGCYRDSLKNDIIKNNTYGLLTIINEIENYISPSGDKCRRVLCKCICGKKKEYNLQTLKSGAAKDCGCVFKKENIRLRKEREALKVIREITPVPEDTEFEKWKNVVGFEGYLISSLGNMFSKKLNVYLNTNRANIRLALNGRKDCGVNISKLVYETFVGEVDEVNYMLIFIDEDSKNTSVDNLFLARRTRSNGSNWVSKLYASMKANGKEKEGQRFKERTVSKKHLIGIYQEQNGLSYFLGIEMDMTCSDTLLSASVDRIDNSKDYVEGNIKLVTRFENMGRRDATAEDFSEFCKKFLKC